MERFACLGSACKDTCCANWEVRLGSGDLERLGDAMDGSSSERQEFARSVRRLPVVNSSDHAAIELKGGRCAFLDADNLCSTQKRYGEDALPDVCSVYPRVMGQVADQVEMWGHLSCPEVARLCLLSEDALELVEMPAATLPRRPPQRALPRDSADPYLRYLDDVRAIMGELLGRRDYSFSTRLLFLAYFSRETASFFHRGTQSFTEELLAEQISRFRQPSQLAFLSQQYACAQPEHSFVATLVLGLLEARLGKESHPLAELTQAVMNGYGANVNALSSGQDVDRIWGMYLARRSQWQAVSGRRIDLYFENYAKNYWLKEWYVGSPDLLAHTQRLSLMVACLQFLLISHPGLIPIPVADGDKQEALDRAVVDTFYRFSRSIKHNAWFSRALDQTIAAKRLSFAQMVQLPIG